MDAIRIHSAPTERVTWKRQRAINIFLLRSKEESFYCRSFTAFRTLTRIT